MELHCWKGEWRFTVPDGSGGEGQEDLSLSLIRGVS